MNAINNKGKMKVKKKKFSKIILWGHGRTYPAIEIAANKWLICCTDTYTQRWIVLQLLKNDQKYGIA